MVNLTKIRSYADYYRLYANSELPDEWKRRFGHDNPERFLDRGNDEPSTMSDERGRREESYLPPAPLSVMPYSPL